MRTLMGYLPATAGSIAFDGADITRHLPYKRALLGIGYVPQGREIFPALSVLDNLRMGCVKARAIRRPTDRAGAGEFPRLKPLLDRVGGVAVGRRAAVAGARPLPLRRTADHPAGRADRGHPAFHHRGDRRDLCSVCGSRGLTMILVEQNLDFIRALSERILMMQKGRITGEIPPEPSARATRWSSEFVGMERPLTSRPEREKQPVESRERCRHRPSSKQVGASNWA